MCVWHNSESQNCAAQRITNNLHPELENRGAAATVGVDAILGLPHLPLSHHLFQTMFIYGFTTFYNFLQKLTLVFMNVCKSRTGRRREKENNVIWNSMTSIFVFPITRKLVKFYQFQNQQNIVRFEDNLHRDHLVTHILLHQTEVFCKR